MSIPQEGGGTVESFQDLVAFLESGCKPPAAWRIGTEHEKFGFRHHDHMPLPYAGECSIEAVLWRLANQFGWTPVLEAEHIIGLTRDGANVSLEPGGQLELSGAPLENLHQTCDEANRHLAEVSKVASGCSTGFLGIGFAPEWRHEDMPQMPKGRYAIMRNYMQKKGRRGLDMMHRTCTVQVNLDFADEADMVRKFRAGLLLQPVATALFANSPFAGGHPSGNLSERAQIWEDVDPDRSGALPFVFDAGFGFEAWAEYALDVPMYFLYRDGRYLDVSGQSFRDFMDARLPGLPGERPRVSDWADHLTTIFPDVRLKQFLEMRGADAGPWRRICALPAFWVGLLYDASALDGVFELTRDWRWEDRVVFRRDAARIGLRAEIGGRSLRAIAADLLDLAHAGLLRRARAAGFDSDETHFLNDLRSVVEGGETLAEEMLRLYATRWNKRVEPLYDEYAF